LIPGCPKSGVKHRLSGGAGGRRDFVSIKERPFLTQETILDIRDMIAETDFEYQREAFVDTRDLD